MQTEYCKDGLDAPGSSKEMAYSTLCAADINLRGTGFAVLAEQQIFNGSVLCCIAERRTRSMSVDVINRFRLQLSVLERFLHRQSWTLAVLARRRHMVCITR